MKEQSNQPKKNIVAHAIIILTILGAYYHLFTTYCIIFDSSNYSSTDNSNKNEDTTYSTYTWTIQDNQVLEIKLKNSDNYYIDEYYIYKGNERVCTFIPEHTSYYQSSYRNAVELGIVEESRRGNLEYVLSGKNSYNQGFYYYLIKIDNFYYTIQLSSDISLEQTKDCFDRIEFIVKKHA